MGIENELSAFLSVRVVSGVRYSSLEGDCSACLGMRSGGGDRVVLGVWYVSELSFTSVLSKSSLASPARPVCVKFVRTLDRAGNKYKNIINKAVRTAIELVTEAKLLIVKLYQIKILQKKN